MRDPERFPAWLGASMALHVCLAVFILVAPSILALQGDSSWGDETGSDGGVEVRLVSNVSGIALPSPPVVREQAVANDSQGLHQTETAPRPEVPVAEKIPDPEAPVKPKPVEREPRRAEPKPQVQPPPDNAVPYGQGGRPNLSYGEFAVGKGTGGVDVGEGIFGQRYGWYVQAMTRKVSQNWLQAMVDSSIQRAPRVYVGFDIQRDGTISNVEIKQSSGIASLDRSAQRAVYASNPLSPLPTDFPGSRVSVSFWFEYVR